MPAWIRSWRQTEQNAGGGNYHEITAAEWAAIALWCHKNGTEPKGNNNYGKDVTETLYRAIPSCAKDSSGQIKRVATGTGSVTWSHDGTLAGIWDMNGNVWEWCIGLRLVYGELQILKDNDAADPAANLSAGSAAWKAIRASDGALVTPNDQGTTEGTVKLDYASGVWKYTTNITGTKGSYGCYFKNVAADSSIGAAAKLLLQALAMLPDAELTGDKISSTYNDDYFYANNIDAERCLHRGGRWSIGANAGVFSSGLGSPRSFTAGHVGGRSALYEAP